MHAYIRNLIIIMNLQARTKKSKLVTTSHDLYCLLSSILVVLLFNG